MNQSQNSGKTLKALKLGTVLPGGNLILNLFLHYENEVKINRSFFTYRSLNNSETSV